MPSITLVDGFSRTPTKRKSHVPNELLSHREVAHELEKARTRHRQPGAIPYPLQYDDRSVLDLYVLCYPSQCIIFIAYLYIVARGTTCFSLEYTIE